MSLFGPSGKSISIRKRLAAQQDTDAAKISARQGILEDTEQRAEQTKMSVLGSLGAPGTYGDNLDDSINPYKEIGGMQIFDPSSVMKTATSSPKSAVDSELAQISSVVPSRFKRPTTRDELDKLLKKTKTDISQFSDEAINAYLAGQGGSNEIMGTATKSGKYYRKIGAGQQILDATKDLSKGLVDPTSYSAAFFKTSIGRTMSAQQAIAQQLVEQKGPLYEKIERAITAPIFDGAAQLGRATMIDLRNMASRGGAARRTALQEATNIAAKLEVRSMVTESLKDAQLKLFNTGQQFGQAVAAFNIDMTDALPMISQQHLSAMKALNDYYTTVVTPTTLNLHGSAAKIRLQIEKERQQAKFSKTMMIAGAAMSVGGGLFGMPAMSMAGTSMFMQGAQGSKAGGFMNAMMPMMNKMTSFFGGGGSSSEGGNDVTAGYTGPSNSAGVSGSSAGVA